MNILLEISKDHSLQKRFEIMDLTSDCSDFRFETRPRGYKTMFMLSSAEHEIFLLINVELPTILGISTFMGKKNSILGLINILS